MPTLRTYVVKFDSGFAPNPFYGFCTLATCKPRIRKAAAIGDWIVGTGSDRIGVRRGGFLVYAMRVTEALTFMEYWSDPRFERKKPNLLGSYRKACGDNIYCPDEEHGGWRQMNSYHTKSDGTPVQNHIKRDTSVNRVLVSDEFAYYGAQGPVIPKGLQNAGIVKPGIGERKISDEDTIEKFEHWFKGLGKSGYLGMPFDMVQEMGEHE